jgi:hypothetical protein
MAPEQVTSGEICAHPDVYAAGIIPSRNALWKASVREAQPEYEHPGRARERRAVSLVK